LPSDGVIFQPTFVFIRVNGQQMQRKRNSDNLLFSSKIAKLQAQIELVDQLI
jgi:hypothetical protein